MPETSFPEAQNNIVYNMCLNQAFLKYKITLSYACGFEKQEKGRGQGEEKI